MKKKILTISLLLLIFNLFVPLRYAQAQDKTCITGDRGKVIGINTALGCIYLDDFNSFTGFLLKIGIGIGGGIAILLIIYAGFIMTTSTGDPKRLQAGKELLGAAIGGTMLLIFAVFILRLLGTNILGVF